MSRSSRRRASSRSAVLPRSGNPAQAGQHVGGLDVAAQRPGFPGGLQQRGNRRGELAAAVLVRVPPDAMTARSASAMPRLVVM